MNMWENYTVVTLRQILLEQKFDQKFIFKLKKSDLIELCEQHVDPSVLRQYPLSATFKRSQSSSQPPSQDEIRKDSDKSRSPTRDVAYKQSQSPITRSKSRVDSSLFRIDTTKRKNSLPKVTSMLKKTPARELSEDLSSHLTSYKMSNIKPHPPITKRILSPPALESFATPARTQSNSSQPAKGMHHSTNDDENSTSSQRRLVVSAGRFSVPSEDIISPERRSVKKRQSRISFSPMRQNIENQFPNKDPKGEEICWRLRTSSLADTNVKDQVVPEKTPSPQKQNKSVLYTKQAGKTRSRIPGSWILLTVVFFFIFAFLPDIQDYLQHSEIQLTSPVEKAHNIYQDMLGISPFCNNTQNIYHCRPCPDRAICEGHHIQCADQMFELKRASVFAWWKFRCVRNVKGYTKAFQGLEKASLLLARLNSIQVCKKESVSEIGSQHILVPIYPEEKSQNVKNYVGLEKSTLMKELVEQQHLSPQQFEQIESLMDVMLDDIPTDLQYPLKVHMKNNVTYYFTPTIVYPFSCGLKLIIYAYLWRVLLFLAVIVSGYLYYRHRHISQTVRTSIPEIISVKTRIEHMPNGKGYASGPTSQEIYQIMNAKPPNRYNPQGWHISLQTITQHCDKLLKDDPKFLKAHIALNVFPHFYCQDVINRLSAHLNTQITSPIVRTKIVI